MLLLVEHVHDLDLTGVEEPMIVPEVLLGQLDLRPHRVAVPQFHLLDLCLGFDDIAVSNLTIIHIRVNPEHIIRPYPHGILTLDIGLEHNKRLLLNDIIVPKNNLKLFLLPFTQNGTCRIYDTPLSEHYISLDLILAHVYGLL